MSRFLDYSIPSAPSPKETPAVPEIPEIHADKIAGLTRHLSARVGEFFCVTWEAHEKAGVVSVVFDGFDPIALQKALSSREVTVAFEDPALVFHLNHRHSFEDIDFLWSILYSILV